MPGASGGTNGVGGFNFVGGGTVGNFWAGSIGLAGNGGTGNSGGGGTFGNSDTCADTRDTSGSVTIEGRVSSVDSASGFAATSCTMCCTGGAFPGHAETPPTTAGNTTAATK